MSGTLRLRGATSGYSELQAPAVAADQTFVLPSTGGTLLTTDSPVPKLTLQLGSASQPSLTFQGDTDTGLFSAGANTLNLVTGGSNRLVIDSSGNVGISGGITVTGGSVLTGNVNIGTTSSAAYLQFPALTGWGPRIQQGGASINDFAVFTNNTEALTVKNSGNVGIGTTSPSTELSIAGSDPQLCLWEGADGASSSKVQLGTGTVEGFINIHKGDGTRTIQLSSGGNSYLNGGNVGIGTTNPAGTFTIYKASEPYVYFQNSASGTSTSDGFSLVYSGSDMYINNREGGFLAYEVSSSEKLRIDSSGRVGIGINSPAEMLHITGNPHSIIRAQANTTTAVSSLYFADPTSAFAGYLQYAHTTDHLEIGTASSEKMRIAADGNVVIGSTNTSYRFNVNSGSTATNTELISSSGNVYLKFQNNASSVGYVGYEGSSLGFYANNNRNYQIYGDGTHVWSRGGNESARIDNNGQICIGCTSFSTSVAGITLRKRDGNYGRMNMIKTVSGARDSLALYYSGTYVGGVIYNDTGVSYYSASDYRLKENVVNILDGIDRIKQLSPKRFNFIASPDATVDGFIAHEVQAVVPEAVMGEKDGERMQSIEQSKLVPVLTAALQEAIAKIETLESEVAALKNN